eukprot:1161635-Pelagomonas_calceolata.AAC.12
MPSTAAAGAAPDATATSCRPTMPNARAPQNQALGKHKPATGYSIKTPQHQVSKHRHISLAYTFLLQRNKKQASNASSPDA